MTPRCAAIHDLSGFGRCSLTIILPVLSAMGVQCCPLPTAYLSTHTGGFTGNTFLDMTAALADAARHWETLGLTFQAVYTGFMASPEQLALAGEVVAWMKGRGALAVIDPVMGDHGRPYRTYTPSMCAAAAELAALGDVITPNLTEAALLLGLDRLPEDHFDQVAARLSLDGRRSVVLTGAVRRAGEAGAVCYDRETGETTFVGLRRAEGEFHGTGDLFTSVLTGALLQGKGLAEGAWMAAGFVQDCVERTARLGTPAREGLDFEPLLGRLCGGSALDGYRGI